MSVILQGVFSGFLVFLAVIFLIMKMKPVFRNIIFKFPVASDIGFTLAAFILLPVVGSSTLISTGTFCVLMSAFLYLNKG